MLPIDEGPSGAGLADDYVPGVLGHLVVARGPGVDGRESVALWQVSPTGRPDGAWIIPTDDGLDAAGRLTGMALGRCVIDWDTTAAVELLESYATAAGRPAGGWRDTAVRLPEVLVDIDRRRAELDVAVEEYRAGSKSKIEPLAWPRRVPVAATCLADLATASRMARPVAAGELAAGVLHTVRLVGWVAGLWQETEQVRLRRRYLQQAYGPATPLPPRWLARLRAANAPAAGRPVPTGQPAGPA